MAKENKRIVEGLITKDTKQKTGVLLTTRSVLHPKYKCNIKLSKKFHFHDENNQCQAGDRALIIESRRFSKLKSWRLLKVVTANSNQTS